MNTATEIMIDGRPVKFRASAATPRFYRLKLGRDLFADLKNIEANVKTPELALESRETIETIERIAWTMAKQADPENTPDDMTEWLDGFSPFAIMTAAPQIFELWGFNLKQLSTAKKKSH